MPPAGPWAGINSELLLSIAAADGVSLRDYKSLRGVCAAWRSALQPPYPCLLSLADDYKGWYLRSAWPSASVFSLPTRRSSDLQLTASSQPLDWRRPRVQARVVGSSNGRFAVAVDHDQESHGHNTTVRIFLLNTRAGKEVELVPPTAVWTYKSGPCLRYVHKVVFAPSPDDLTVVALYDHKNVAYIDMGTSRHQWTTIDVVASNTVYGLDAADLAFHDDSKLYCLDSYGGVHVVSMPRRGRNSQYERAVVEPLLCNSNQVASFAPPYDRVCALALTATKHLFFCNGGVYQMWQNKDAAVTLAGSCFRMAAHEIFVLRYDRRRWTCWEPVRDLGGCSVFIGKNSNPAVVRVVGRRQPWVRANCLYWIDYTRVPMVCDIATGTSKPCILPYGACKGNCWYFDEDVIDGNRIREEIS